MYTLTDWIASFDVSSFLAILLVLATAGYYWSPDPRKNLPPGPLNLPIVGHVPFMIGRKIEDAFAEWKAKYGDIVYVRMGGQQIVNLASYEAISEALISNPDIAVIRPERFSAINYIFQHLGLIVENGKVWQEHRRFLMRTFRDLGLGKQNLETEMQNEIAVVVKELKKHVGKPFNPQKILLNAAINIISALLFGIRYKHDDPKFIELVDTYITLAERVSPYKLVNSFPAIRHFLPASMSGLLEVDISKDYLYRYLDATIDSHSDHSEDSTQDYVNTYLNKQNEDTKKGVEDSTFTSPRLRSNALVLTAGGTMTTYSTIYWALKYAIKHPEIQEKVHKEIDTVIGSERLLCYLDKPNLPYTDAFLMEVQRCADVVPFGVPHGTKVDTKIRGYDIPKGTTILPLLTMVHHNPKIWGDPENFRPERFIGDDGKVKKSEYLIPFSMGKRNCPGENLALTEVFIYFATIMQNFTIRPASSKDVDLYVEIVTVTRDPSPFEIIFESR